MPDDHHRYEALEALTSFLEGRTDVHHLYQWALKKATASDYTTVIAQDVLMKELIEVILEIHARSETGEDNAPLEMDGLWREAVTHYQACLSGSRVFVPEGFRIPVRDPVGQADASMSQKKTEGLSRWYHLARAYVMMFALGVIGVHGIALWRPEWWFPEGQMSRMMIVKESWPLWVYGLIVLVPPRVWAGGAMFYPIVVVLTAGMVYFWHITLRLITPVQWHAGFLLLVGLTAALPATLALLLQIDQRRAQRKEEHAP